MSDEHQANIDFIVDSLRQGHWKPALEKVIFIDELYEDRTRKDFRYFKDAAFTYTEIRNAAYYQAFRATLNQAKLEMNKLEHYLLNEADRVHDFGSKDQMTHTIFGMLLNIETALTDIVGNYAPNLDPSMKFASRQVNTFNQHMNAESGLGAFSEYLSSLYTEMWGRVNPTIGGSVSKTELNNLLGGYRGVIRGLEVERDQQCRYVVKALRPNIL